MESRPTGILMVSNSSHSAVKRRKLCENSTQDKRKYLLPVERLVMFLCCSLFCMSGIALEDLCLQRNHYQEKSRHEKSQFIMDYMIMNTSSTGKCTFMIGPTRVCATSWRVALGIPESTFYNIKKQVADGKKIIFKSGKTTGYMERKTQMAFVWLKDFTSTFASAMPDSSKLHLPCCLTKTSVYEMMKSDLKEIQETSISKTHFFKIWRTDLRHIAIPRRSRFSECTICALIKKSLGETKNKIIKEGLLEQRNKHLWQQRSEREKYYKHQLKAKREPNKYLSIIMDAMDQSKTMIPHFAKPPKSTDSMWKVKTHLLAAKVHGIGIYGFFDYFQYPHGSNLTISSLISIITMLKDSIPEVLYLQMDNCGRENKNRFVIAFLCHLVELGIFKKIKLSFLMKGHTHEDIDQIFSRFSVWLNKKNAMTINELMDGFQQCFTPNPISIEQTNVIDYSNWIMPHLNPMTKHSKPHVFRIAQENGKAKISCKKWSTDKVYLDCVGSEQFLLKTVPSDSPTQLPPIYSDLDKVQNTIKMGFPFMSKKHIDDWNTFFVEKEEEELDFSNTDVSPSVNLMQLAEEIKRARQEKAHPAVAIPLIVHDDEEIEPQMFPAVCHQFAHAMGRHTLIPSPSVDDSTKIVPLNVVVKRKKRRWIFFHKIEYTTYEFPLHQLLIGRAVLETKIEESKFCSYNPESTYSLNGKFGADIMKDIMDASLSASDKVTITAKLGELLLQQIGNHDAFMNELMTKQIDMKHPLIKQIVKEDKDTVLCVVRGVIVTSDKAEIKRTDTTDGNIKVSEKIKGTVDVESGASASNVRDIIIEPGTTIAYKVWELKVNTMNGVILPVMTSELRGGFSSMDASGGHHHEHGHLENEEEKPTVKHLEDKVEPLLGLTRSDRQQLKASLLVLMTCSSDVVLLSNLLSKAEEGTLKEEKSTHDKQFINKDAVWSILKIAGVKVEDEKVFYEGETTPVLSAIAYVVDALSELENPDLENLCKCSEQQLRSLSKVLELAVTKSMPITVDVDNESVFEEPVCSFLKDLAFTLYELDKTVLPPRQKSSIVECIFCVLYCLSRI